MDETYINESDANNPTERCIRDIWNEKYRYLNESNPSASHERVVRAVYANDPNNSESYEMLGAINSNLFIPGGRILAGAGTPYDRTLMNCYVSPSPEDSLDSIMHCLKIAAVTQQAGGGIGVYFGNLRPRGAAVKRSGSESTGPVSFMHIWDTMAETIRGGGNRRAAMIATMPDWHADLIEFIESKRVSERLTHFNISVLISNEFMEAVEIDGDWKLGHSVPPYSGKYAGVIERDGKPWYVYEVVKARRIWNSILQSTFKYSEPGVVFIDRVNSMNPLSYCETIRCTNPCQPADATVLTPIGISTVGNTKIGDTIWSGKEWTKVVAKYRTGIKQVYKYITTAGYFLGTANHDVLQNGNKVAVEDACSIDICTGTEPDSVDIDLQDVVDGWILGDGSVHKASNNKVYLCLGDNDHDIYEVLHDYIIGKTGIKDKAILVNTTISHEELPNTFNRHIPDRFKYATRDKVCGFLKGLYSANGSICGGRVTLKASSQRLINDVQEMLSAIGIPSYVTFNKGLEVKFSNGIYECRDSYDLNITRGRNTFFRLIGFCQKYKADKLKSIINATSVPCKPVKTSYEIISIVEIGEQEVFSITVDNKDHTYWTGCLLVSNCGEIPQPEDNVCCLGHVNLAKMIRADKFDCLFRPTDTITFRHMIDHELLERVIRSGVRFLDNVLDVSFYPLEQQRKEAMSKRRIGLGVTGFGNLLQFLGMRYGSPDSVYVTKYIMGNMRDWAYDESVKLAKERGAFPALDRDKFIASNFVSKMIAENDIRHGWLDDFKRYGIRNGSLLAIAPTGTGSLYVGNVSSGIEPTFAWKAQRTVLFNNGPQKYEVEDFGYKHFRRMFGDHELPDFMVTATQLSPKEHIDIVAAAQQYIDHSVSKTINVSHDIEFDSFKQVYNYAYESGCKSCTTYRPSEVRGAVLKEVNMTDKEVMPDTVNGDSVTVNGDGLIMRPSMLTGKTYKFKWGEGPAYYMTVNDIEVKGRLQPFEVFINSMDVQYSEYVAALTRMISAIFRRSHDTSFVHEELGKIYSARGGQWVDGKYVPSLIAMIGKVLERHYISCNRKERIIGGVEASVLESVNTVANANKFVNFCPKCMSSVFIHQENCAKCTNCGYSNCE